MLRASLRPSGSYTPNSCTVHESRCRVLHGTDSAVLMLFLNWSATSTAKMVHFGLFDFRHFATFRLTFVPLSESGCYKLSRKACGGSGHGIGEFSVYPVADRR